MTLHKAFQTEWHNTCWRGTDDQMENTQYKKFIIKYYIFSHISQIISFDITSYKALYIYEWNIFFFETANINWNKMKD